MYQPISNHINETLTKGLVVLPIEDNMTKVIKMKANQFLAVDYRISNPVLLSNDEESHTNGEIQITDEISNYILGFALVRNVSQMKELKESNKATITRFKNKLLEITTKVLSKSSMRKNRGNRSVYLNIDNIIPLQSTVDSLMLKPANPQDWILIPFLMSTTIFYNNFRANLGVGLKNQELENIKNDVQTRLITEFDIIRDKLNKQLETPINDSLLGKIFLVSPKDIMKENYGQNIFDYVNKKFINSSSKTFVDATKDEDFIPIPGVMIGNIKSLFHN